MKNTLWTCVAFALWGLTASAANACFCSPMVFYYPPCYPPPYAVAYQTRDVIAYKTEWREEKVPIVITKVNYREEKTKVKVTVYVPQTFPQKVTTSFYVPVPKVVQRDVWTCVPVPVAMFDPCSCCCYLACYPQWVARKVQYTVSDYKLQTRVDEVKVVKMVPQEKLVDQVRMIPETTQEKSFTVRRYCVAVPYKTKIMVPVVVPCCWP